MSKPQHQEIARLIKSLRMEAGLKQADLAERLDLTQSVISKYESGELGLDLIEIREICLACGISLVGFVERLEARLKEGRRAR